MSDFKCSAINGRKLERSGSMINDVHNRYQETKNHSLRYMNMPHEDECRIRDLL